ncbi:high-affinity lysophosphatidic acid receptor [Caerostris darwini]|uniref:High-affinity lysophosphatidic acid receptor n=1 Tax=Caerostris darwini TaxID=1538125 RepID=A0AAV4SGB6_9ARAC|nr:high-affinity lysophosphatidic acid receptor [Caerostris darwini]
MNNTSNDGNSTCNVNQSDGIRASYGTALIFVILVGGVGNCLLTFLVLRHTEMRSVINILLALMAISDAFLSIFCAPMDLIAIISHDWMFGSHFCSAHAFLLSVFVVQNVTVLVIISIDRYCILIHKINHLHGCRPTRLVLGCLVFSVAVSCPPLFGVGQFTFVNEHCGQNIQTTDHGLDAVIYFGLFSILLFVLPCSLLLLAYVHILVALRKSIKTVRPESRRMTCSQFLKGHQDIDVRFKQKTFSTILCLYLAAMIFKLPLAVTLLVKSITRDIQCPVSIRVVVLAYLNGAVNPFIYACKITSYWMVLTGRLREVKNRINSRRSSRRKDRQTVYRISSISTSSVI